MENQEPPITFQHLIGEQQIELYMLRRELNNAQQTIQEQQELITELRESIPEEEENHPIEMNMKRSS